jgi:hypothetical protein
MKTQNICPKHNVQYRGKECKHCRLEKAFSMSPEKQLLLQMDSIGRLAQAREGQSAYDAVHERMTELEQASREIIRLRKKLRLTGYEF